MNETSNFLTSFDVTLILKPLALFVVALYIVFTLVIVKQVQVMTSFLGSRANPIIRILSWAHFLASAAIFVAVLLFI